MNDDVIILDLEIIIMAEGGPSASASSSSYSNSDVNEQYLKSLMEMGIHRDNARQVLISVVSSFRSANFHFRL